MLVLNFSFRWLRLKKITWNDQAGNEVCFATCMAIESITMFDRREFGRPPKERPEDLPAWMVRTATKVTVIYFI